MSSILEWNAPTVLQEIFETNELLEFQSTLATLPTDLVTLQRSNRADPERRMMAIHKRKRVSGIFSSDTDDAASPKKKSRSVAPKPLPERKASTPPITLAPAPAAMLSAERRRSRSKWPITLSICEAIPEPRCKFMPTPRNEFKPPPNHAEVLPKLTEHPIHCFVDQSGWHRRTRTSPSKLPAIQWNAPFARGAWIIPINGNALVESASSASLHRVLDAEILRELPAAGDTVRYRDHLHWTAVSVQETWKSLVGIRDGGFLGPVSVFVECRSSRKRGSHDVRQEWIKVCCDGEHALRLRSLVAQFRVRETAIPGPEESTTLQSASTRFSEVAGNENTNIRKFLLGARLVYVDETGYPLFVG